jgi:disulfide oxidoreductase YuzD
MKSLFATLIGLAAVVLASAVTLAGDPPGSATGDTAIPSASGATEPGSHLVRVYYFRTERRCASCRRIEAYTDEAVKSAFERELKDKTMAWEVVNIEERGNEHFVQDYKLYTKSVVVVDVVHGKQTRWKNLAKIWELLDDQAAFERYVQDEVRQYLEGRS